MISRAAPTLGSQALAETVRLHPVGQAVGDGLRLFALFVGHLVGRDAKDRAGDGAMHVLVRG